MFDWMGVKFPISEKDRKQMMEDGGPADADLPSFPPPYQNRGEEEISTLTKELNVTAASLEKALEMVRELETHLVRIRTQRNLYKRGVEQLHMDWPAIYKRYFTEQGEQDQLNGVPTKAPRRK